MIQVVAATAAVVDQRPAVRGPVRRFERLLGAVVPLRRGDLRERAAEMNGPGRAWQFYGLAVALTAVPLWLLTGFLLQLLAP